MAAGVAGKHGENRYSLQPPHWAYFRDNEQMNEWTWFLAIREGLGGGAINLTSCYQVRKSQPLAPRSHMAEQRIIRD